MARAARNFAQIDVHYFEDDRVLEAGDAWQLHFAAILACKRNLTDGTATRRQLARVAPESVPDIAPMTTTLIQVGLFIDRGDSIEVSGWANWNTPTTEIEVMSRGGIKGNHLRHHVNRGKWRPKCPICREQKDRGLSAPESPPDSRPSRREDVDPDVDEDFDFDEIRGGDSSLSAESRATAELSPLDREQLAISTRQLAELGYDMPSA
jgi:hypothetical protein